MARASTKKLVAKAGAPAMVAAVSKERAEALSPMMTIACRSATAVRFVAKQIRYVFWANCARLPKTRVPRRMTAGSTVTALTESAFHMEHRPGMTETNHA